MALPGSARSVDEHKPLSQTVRQGNRPYPTSPIYGITRGGAMRDTSPNDVFYGREIHVPVRPGNPACPVSDTYADGVPEDISSEDQE